MAKMKKKTMMKKPTRLNVLAASLMMMAMPLTQSATTTTISDLPLVGVTENFAPHVVLALSVEYPTAGAAYSTTNVLYLQNNDHTKPYLGYFDNQKCYTYNHTDGYFEPSSFATNYMCSGSNSEEFSGNVLNFLTMSSIDIFRKVMTGGNRAKGDGTDAKNYQDGDTETESYLRRARVMTNDGIQTLQNGKNFTYMPNRSISFNANQKDTLKKLVPAAVVDELLKDVWNNKPAKTKGLPREYGFKVHHRGMPIYANGGYGVAAHSRKGGDTPNANDSFTDQMLHFFNNGFGFNMARRVNVATTNYTAPQGITNLQVTDSSQYYDTEYYVFSTNSKWAKNFNVVVKVCDPKDGGKFLESDLCVAYGSNYKPEGLLQKYTKENKMRFATFGYANLNTGTSGTANTQVDAAVLRSPMKMLIDDPDKATGVYGEEWDTKKGTLVLNPESKTASEQSVANSGTINYLNKFGDFTGYKEYDPGAELYNAALQYLMGTKNPPYKPTMTAAGRDGFPTIYNWDDPYIRGIENEKEYHCHQNNIIFIGDTNTHDELNVDSRGKTYLTKLLENEPKSFYSKYGATANVGSGASMSPYYRQDNNQVHYGSNGKDYSPAYIAGLAYWARVNNIRPDLTTVKNPTLKPINGNNFMIDVVEEGNFKITKRTDYAESGKVPIYEYKPFHNSYFLAAKYGGFERDENKLNDTNELPTKREQWTDDPAGTSNVSAFLADMGGTPRNYAVANNPLAMTQALQKAMKSSAAMNNPAQAATGLSVTSGEIVDLSDEKVSVTLQSTYNFAELTGDVIASSVAYRDSTDTTLDKNILLKNTEKWRLSTDVNKYHGSINSRKHVFTHNASGTVVQFNEANADSIFKNVLHPSTKTEVSKDTDVKTLTKYVLGDSSLEGTTYRTRSGILGTFVNSTVQPITAVGGDLKLCSYKDLAAAQTRKTHYTAASNNGLLHVFDNLGVEKMAYMPRTSLRKLPAFAKSGYTHQFINDGTPVVSEVCLNNEATSIALGVAGRGGQSVYALNVTDLSSPSAKNVLWEFNNDDDPDLGYTLGTPSITNSVNNNARAIVSGGYNSDGEAGYLFILDIGKTGSWNKGSNYWKYKLGDSNLGTPFVYDEDKDGIADKIFVGDTSGKIWQLNRKVGTDEWVNPYGTSPMFETGDGMPISGAPYAEKINGKLMVVAASGQYLSDKDLDTEQQNYAYGLIVKDDEWESKMPLTPIDKNALLQQEVTESAITNTDLNKNGVNGYTSTAYKMEDQHQGWRVKLLKGQNIAANATIRKSQAAEFTAVRITKDVSESCQRSGSTSYLSFDVTNGGLNSKPIFDTNFDGSHDSQDVSVSVYEITGMTTSQSTLITVRLKDGSTKTLIRGTDGGKIADVNLNKLESSDVGVRRISWREIF